MASDPPNTPNHDSDAEKIARLRVLYADYRKQLIESSFEAAKSFDQWTLTLGGGGFGLSLAIVNDLVGDGPAKAVSLLIIAWIALALSIILGLVGLRMSHHAHDATLAILDAAARKDPERLLEIAMEKRARLISVRAIGGLNNWVTGVLLVGIVCLAVFAFVNL